jgi:hypothetical protein
MVYDMYLTYPHILGTPHTVPESVETQIGSLTAEPGVTMVNISSRLKDTTSSVIPLINKYINFNDLYVTKGNIYQIITNPGGIVL